MRPRCPKGLTKEALKKAPGSPTCNLWRQDGLHSGKIEADLTRGQSLLQQALESLGQLRDEAATSVLEPTQHPQQQMDVEDPEEEFQRLRVQVAESEESRAQKVRVPLTPTLDLAPLHLGVARLRSASEGDAHSHRCGRFSSAQVSQQAKHPTRDFQSFSECCAGVRLLFLNQSLLCQLQCRISMLCTGRLEIGGAPAVVDMNVDDSDRESQAPCQAADTQF